MWLATAAAFAIAVAIALALDLGGVRRWIGGRPTAVPHIASLAVIPLDNLSGDPEQQYFADGMTDALITDLAKIGSLRIMSCTSVMSTSRRSGRSRTSGASSTSTPWSRGPSRVPAAVCGSPRS